MNKVKNALTVYFPDYSGDERFVIWLWHILLWKTSFFDMGNSSPFEPDSIEVFFRNNKNLVAEVISKRVNVFAPIDRFLWINGDERQYNWIVKQLSSGTLDFYAFSDFPSVKYIDPRLNLFERIVLMFDAADMPMSAKISMLERLYFGWNNHINRDICYDWFRRKEEVERCSFFWEWLRKDNSWFANGLAPIKNHQEVILFFEKSNINEDKKLLMIERVKKAWSQKKYREDRQEKKQCNLLLSINTLKLLDSLSMKHGIPRAAIVELLIHDEYSSEI